MIYREIASADSAVCSPLVEGQQINTKIMW